MSNAPKSGKVLNLPAVNTSQNIDGEIRLDTEKKFFILSTELAELLGLRHDNFMRLIDSTLETLGGKEFQSPHCEEIESLDARNRTQRAFKLEEVFASYILAASNSPAKTVVLDILQKRSNAQKDALRMMQAKIASLNANTEKLNSFTEKTLGLLESYPEHIIVLIFRRCEGVIKSRTRAYEHAQEDYSDEDNGTYDDFSALRAMRKEAIGVYVAMRTILELVSAYPEWSWETLLGVDRYTEKEAHAWLKKARAADNKLLKDSKFPEMAWSRSFQSNVDKRWKAAHAKFKKQTERFDQFSSWLASSDELKKAYGLSVRLPELPKAQQL